MGFDMQAVKDIGNAGYFGLNIWNMGVLRSILDRTGVLDWEAASAVPEPCCPSCDHEEHRFEWEWFGKARAARVKALGKVAAQKFVNNEGWLVEPDECRLLADAVEKHGPKALVEVLQQPNGGMDEAAVVMRREIERSLANVQFTFTPALSTIDHWVEIVRDFVAFCRRCEVVGGFTVY